MAAYSAANMQQMAILMGNDAGLPLGTGFDNRKPDQILDSLRLVTDALAPYRAFRGWDWASNWWVFDQRGSAAAQTPDEKSAYEAALKRAQETGAWDAVLDRVADRRLEPGGRSPGPVPTDVPRTCRSGGPGKCRRRGQLGLRHRLPHRPSGTRPRW